MSLLVVAYLCLSLLIVAYRCLSLLVVACRVLLLLIFAYRSVSLLIVAYPCLSSLVVAYLCLSLLIVAYRCLSLPYLTLLHFTLHYLTSPGVRADGGAINTINAFQETMFKCTEMLYNFDFGFTYKVSRNVCRELVLLLVLMLRGYRCVRAKRRFSITVLNPSC